MRLALLLCCALWFTSASTGVAGMSWYVAPNGDDTAAGSLERPFSTIQRGQQAASPGDTVFIRGGTYRLAESHIAKRQGLFARIIVLDKSGTKEQPITYRAYADEKPVFDCSDVKPRNQRVSAFYVSGSWLHLIGLDVTGVQVTIKTHTQSICFESQGSHNIFERLTMHDGQAIGVYHVRGADNLFLNCDAWNNWDFTSEDGKGGNVDGFGCHPTKGSTGNVFRGCRAWYNSDDGYDCITASESVTFENCWAAYNGFSAKDTARNDGPLKDLAPRQSPVRLALADGNGFKAGGYGSAPASSLPDPIPRHIVRDCLAVGNKNSGFYANHHPGGGDWMNNKAYRNGANYNMLGRLHDNRTDVDGTGHKLTGNLSHGARRDLISINRAECQVSGNSFDQETKLTDNDFVSLDESELFGPRQPSGDLPDIKFLRRKAPEAK